MQLDKDSLLEMREQKDGGDEGSRDSKDREQVPRALTKAMPGKSDDANHNICDQDECDGQKDIVYT